MMSFLESGYQVVAYDINDSTVERLSRDIEEKHPELSERLCVTSDSLLLKRATFHIVAVPTPTAENNKPDLSCLKGACEAIGPNLKRGDIVVFESTTYPGCTEEYCLPILLAGASEEASLDIHVGYSPERINPGDDAHNVKSVVKVISAQDAETLKVVKEVYSTICPAGVYEARSIRVAEASKLLENVQRDVNIALMNEFATILRSDKIDIQDVLDVASTKWNFVNVRPGLVGGHCIAVDPYYFIDYAQKMGEEARVTSSARETNSRVVLRIAERIANEVARGERRGLRVLIMGMTYKPDVDDVRNSQSIVLYNIMSNDASGLYGSVETHDPYVKKTDIKGKYDVIVITTPHREYIDMGESVVESLLNPMGIVFDVTGRFKGLEGRGIRTMRL